jgi:hypothetical protein
MSVDKHSPDSPHDLSVKRLEPDFDIEEVFAAETAAEAPSRPAPFESVTSEGRSSSGVWPLMLALVVGIALGFGMAMLLLGRDRVPFAPQQAATSPGGAGRGATEVRDEPVREVTEQTVAAAPKQAAPEPAAAAKPDASRPVATTPVPAPSTSANVKPSVAKPAATTPARPAPERTDSRVAKTPTPRPPGRTPLSAAKTVPSPSKAAATPTRPAPGATKSAASSAPGRGANKAAAVPATKAAAPTPEKPAAGSLVVDSRPAGASVYVDGRLVGTTPFVLETLKAGQYTIGLDIEGYKRWATTVRVTSGERSRVAASLER